MAEMEIMIKKLSEPATALTVPLPAEDNDLEETSEAQIMQAFRKRIDLKLLKDLPQPVVPESNTTMFCTLRQLRITLVQWDIAPEQYPFTQAMLQAQFPPQAPLSDAILSLLGDCGPHWFDCNAVAPGPQVVPLECCKVLLRQLNKVAAQLVDETLESTTEDTCYAGLVSASKAWQKASTPYSA